MTDLTVDPARLRATAALLDQLFTSTSRALSDLDTTIDGSGAGWAGPAESAFATFTGYLAARRIALQRHLATASESLTTAANSFHEVDTAHAAALTDLSP
ncbi:WXG100 family type VII secretion target [Nocardia takedensis]